MEAIQLEGAARIRIRLDGVSQAELSRKTGLDQAGISRFMSGGGLKLGTYLKLIRYLGLEIRVVPVKKRK